MKNPGIINNPFMATKVERPKSSVSVCTYDDRPSFVLIQHQLTGRELVALEEGTILSRQSLTQITEVSASHSLLHVVTANMLTAEQRYKQVQVVAQTIASVLANFRQADIGFNDQPVPLDAYDIPAPGIEELPLLGYAQKLFSGDGLI